MIDGPHWFGRNGVCADHLFHPDYVVPTAEFITTFVKGSHWVIAQMGVKVGAVIVQIFICMCGVGNAGIQVQNVLCL